MSDLCPNCFELEAECCCHEVQREMQEQAEQLRAIDHQRDLMLADVAKVSEMTHECQRRMAEHAWKSKQGYPHNHGAHVHYAMYDEVAPLDTWVEKLKLKQRKKGGWRKWMRRGR
jgi:hypothetical protein